MTRSVRMITAEIASQKASVVLVGDRMHAKHLRANGWVDCSKGAEVIWVHPDLRNPADDDQVFVHFEDAREIQSRWELGWPDVAVAAVPRLEPDAGGTP